jgi:hypothetical protein
MGIEKKMRSATSDPIKIMPMLAEGMYDLVNRRGGNAPLPVLDVSPGVYLSTWAIHQRDVRKLLLGRTPCALQLVVDTNVPGHPSVSMSIVQIALTK